MKTCTKCNELKSLASFSKQAKGKFGVTSICKGCTSERGKRWNRENRERAAASRRAYAEKNAAAMSAYRREWRKENAERLKAMAARWTAENKDSKGAATAKRRAMRKKAIPPWARMDDIKRFYVLAKRLTLETGVRANVDHIVPLQSPLVCGLHCAANLSIASEIQNKSKGNLWWPHMWGRDEELDL